MRRDKSDRATWLESAASELAPHWGARSQELVDAWAALPYPLHEPNIELAEALRRSGESIGILSNAPTGLADMLTTRFGVDVDWDTVVSSSDVGVAKPDSRIYELAAEHLGLDPSVCFFVDDLLENVEAARGVGMQSHHFTGDYGELADALRAAGHSW